MQPIYDDYAVESSITKAANSQRAMKLQLATAGFYVIGILTMLIGFAMTGCGVVNIVVGMGDRSVTGFLPGIFKTLTGVFTVVNGLIFYKVSQKAVIKLKQLKVMFIMTCIATVMHLVSFVISSISIFNAYIKFGDDLLATCNRDANSFASVVANSGYSGAQLNPNYNPNCVASNPNCNINAYPILNYNFNFWYSQMQNYILQLYNYYRYVFRYSYDIDSLHVLFAAELMAAEIGQLIIIGNMINHIQDEEQAAKDFQEAPDPTLIGSQMAIPHKVAASKPEPGTPYSSKADASATATTNEPIYVNIRAANRAPNGRNSPVGQSSSWSIYNISQNAGQVHA